MALFRDLTGERFGRLLVRERAKSRAGKAMWLAMCDCGGHATVCTHALKSAHTKSCGCLHKEQLIARELVHGCSRIGAKTPEYRAWQGAKRRCDNIKKKQWKDYGGRGIVVCDRWLGSFEAFLADMGPRPSPKHSLDRRDNDGPYSKANCRWATRNDQRANQRVPCITRGALIQFLAAAGPMTTKEAASALGKSWSTMRKHFLLLERSGAAVRLSGKYLATPESNLAA